MSNKTKGYIFGIIAAATYGMNPLFALPLYADGLNANQVLLLRYLFALIILFIMIKWRGQSMLIEKKQILPLVCLGLLVGFSSLFLFKSYSEMAAGIASTLLFVYPLMVAVIMTAVYHERLNITTIICILMALGGVALLYKGEDGATLSAYGTVLVMLSALSYAIYLVWVNRPAFKNIPTLVLSFYVISFGSSIFLIEPITTGNISLPSSALTWGCAIALGLLPTAISLVCTTIAIQKIGSTPTAILGAIEPLTAIFFGMVVFGETLTQRDVIGLSLILIAVSIVIAGDNISVALLRMRKMFPAFYNKLRRDKTHNVK